MSQYTTGKPWLYKGKWLVFPDTIFSDLNSIDCNDTINGTCYMNKSFDECMNICNSNENCNVGYYISGSGHNICVPVKTIAHINPVYRLRNKNIYPSTKNLNVQSFMNTDVYKFPPDTANAVFFEDFFELENIQTGLKIKLSRKESVDTSRIEMGKENAINIQFLPYKDVTEKTTVYLQVHYGDNLVINIPGTNLIMLKDGTEGLNWVSRILSSPDIQNTFKIHSVNNKDGEDAYFGDTVYITYQDVFLVQYNPDSNTLNAVYETYETARQENKNIYFRLVPKIETHVCENSKCRSINLNETETKGVVARYKGNLVARNPSCWGCIQPDMSGVSAIPPFSFSKSHWVLIIGILFILVIGILIVWKWRH